MGAEHARAWLHLAAGAPLVDALYPERLASFQAEVAKRRGQLFSYVLFLRVTPLLPNVFINMASPIAGVPLRIFCIGAVGGGKGACMCARMCGCLCQCLLCGGCIACMGRMLAWAGHTHSQAPDAATFSGGTHQRCGRALRIGAVHVGGSQPTLAPSL